MPLITMEAVHFVHYYLYECLHLSKMYSHKILNL